MLKPFHLGACLVCMAALMGAGAASARAGGTSVPVLARQPAEFGVLTSSTANLVEQTLSQMLRYTLGTGKRVPSADSGLEDSTLVSPTIWSGEINSGNEHHGGEGEHHGWKKGGSEGGEDDDEGEIPPHAPTPEPSTLLSFGAALAIGGGVFLLGRLRKERK